MSLMKPRRPSAVGQRIQGLRERTGLSARAVSKLAGLRSETHLSAIESRLDNLEVATLSALARVFGTTIDYLANGVGAPPSDRALKSAIAEAQAAYAAAHPLAKTGS
jgi:transcriptional regulator with XRE-family HTH domain